MLVKDIQPGFLGSSPVFMGVVNEKLIFSAFDGTHGGEPWVSDGTEAGTVMLQDILDPGVSSSPLEGINYNGHLYFFAHSDNSYEDDLWRTDGTIAGTEHFLNVLPGEGDIQFNTGGRGVLHLFGGYLYFLDAHPTLEDVCALWRTDGTAQGTEMLSGELDVSRSLTPLGSYADHLYFSVPQLFGGEVLCRIDLGGTIDTVFALNSFGASIRYPTGAANGLYFIGEDQANGRELYWTDGTTAGTHMVSSFTGSGPTGFSHNYDHSWFHLAGDTLLFAASDSTLGRALWRSDGTVAGTHLVKDLVPGSSSGTPISFFAIGAQVYFATIPDDSSSIYTTDGTEAGTTPLFSMEGLEFLGVNGDALMLLGNDPRELYLSHGGVNDTVRITAPGDGAACCDNVSSAMPALGGYFLSAYVEELGEELFFYGEDVGIDPQSQARGYSVYPVPADDRLTVDVEASTTARIRIHNAVGVNVLGPQILMPTKGVDVSALPPGVYIITVEAEGEKWSQRFIKQ